MHSDKKYEDIVEKLLAMLPMYQRVGDAAYKANLDNTLLLDAYYGHPHKLFKSVHIAGTNGKGSVSHMVAAVLQSAGYVTGLYTSPHYLDFRERIKVNGQCIDKTFVIDFTQKSRKIIEQLQPSFFELTVMMAFDYFQFKKVDVAVIETGMGGRLDSTNVVSPVLSVITNIGHDHQKFLGNTLPVIAKEKAGIIKSGVPVVIGETQTETINVFKMDAEKKGADMKVADTQYSVMYHLLDEQMNQLVHLQHHNQEINVKCDLFGQYQHKNLITALTAIDELKKDFSISEDFVYRGLAGVRKLTGMIGRFELLGMNPRFFCDAAHNEEAFREMLLQLRQIPFKTLHIMLGFVNDKPVGKILEMLPVNARCYFTRADIPRAMPAKELKRKAQKAALVGDVYNRSTEALKAMEKQAGPDDLMMVTGSVFLVAEIIKAKKNVNSFCE